MNQHLEDINHLIEKLPESRDEVIERSTVLVKGVVKRLIRRCPRLKSERDELISVGYLRLVKAVDDLIDKKHERTTGYLVVAVRNAIFDYLKCGNLPDGSPNYKKEELLIPHQVPLTDRPAPGNAYELEEFIDSILTPKERPIVELCKLGYTQCEVGRMLQISQSWVCRILQNIEQRYEKAIRQL